MDCRRPLAVVLTVAVQAADAALTLIRRMQAGHSSYEDSMLLADEADTRCTGVGLTCQI